MKKVLLAIDGMTLDRRVFSYAVELCKRIKTELDILQIIRLRTYSRYAKKVRQGSHHAKRYIEGAMIAATFAEAGEHEMAKEMKEMKAEALRNINQLLPEPKMAGIPWHLTMRSGSPDQEILSYVNDHRNIVLTIYDASEEEGKEAPTGRKKKTLPREIREKLSTPIVMMKEYPALHHCRHSERRI
jgi:hypothetical protein